MVFHRVGGTIITKIIMKGLIAFVACVLLVLVLPVHLCFGEGSVENLIRKLQDPDPVMRRGAAETLGETDDERAFEPLIAALRDKDPQTVVAAVKALAKKGDERALSPLMNIMAVMVTKDRDGTVVHIRDFKEPTQAACRRIIESLDEQRLIALLRQRGQYSYLIDEIVARLEGQGKAGIEPLRQSLDNSTPYVMKEVILALGRLGDIAATAELIPLLDDGSDSRSVPMAEALKTLGTPAMENFLSAAFSQGRETGLRAVYVLRHVGPTATEPLSPLLEHEDPRVRMSIVMLFFEWKDARTLNPLLKALKDEDANVRDLAATILGELKSPRAVDGLVEALQDGSPPVRAQAANSLGMIDDPAVVAPLLEAMLSKDRDLYHEASRALRELRNPLAAAPLSEALREGNWEVRDSVANALANLGGFGVKPLLEHLKEEGVIRGRNNSAAFYLARIGEPAVDPLVNLLGEEKNILRLKVVWALGEIRDQKAALPLEVFLGNPDVAVRAATVRALGKIRAEKSLKPLLASLKDQDASVREEAIRAVSPYKSPEGLRSLESLLANWWSRKAAASALRNTGTAGIEVLLGHLENENWIVRDAAVEALCERNSSIVASNLAEILKERSSDAAWYSALCLAQMPYYSAKLLQDIVEEGEPGAVMRARWALDRLADAAPVAALREDLSDDNDRIREIACRYIEPYGDRSAVKTLTTLLRDEDPYVQLAAARALGSFKDDNVLMSLIEALTEGSVPGRSGAALAIGQQRSPAAVEPLLAALTDSSPAVRISAVLALGVNGEFGRGEVDAALLRLQENDDPDLEEAAKRAFGTLHPPPIID